MTAAEIIAILKFKWRWGGPRDFWLVNTTHVEGFIKEHNITPQSEHIVMPQHQTQVGAQAEAVESSQIIFDPWIYGGMRIPHLHFKGRIYMLNEKQWNEFSGTILKDFKAKLEHVNTVNFEQLMDLSEAVNNIA